MGLTEHEKRELDAIEQHLAQEDPAFATKLSKPWWHLRLSGTALFAIGLLTTYVAGLPCWPRASRHPVRAENRIHAG